MAGPPAMQSRKHCRNTSSQMQLLPPLQVQYWQVLETVQCSEEVPHSPTTMPSSDHTALPTIACFLQGHIRLVHWDTQAVERRPHNQFLRPRKGQARWLRVTLQQALITDMVLLHIQEPFSDLRHQSPASLQTSRLLASPQGPVLSSEGKNGGPVCSCLATQKLQVDVPLWYQQGTCHGLHRLPFMFWLHFKMHQDLFKGERGKHTRSAPFETKLGAKSETRKVVSEGRSNYTQNNFKKKLLEKAKGAVSPTGKIGREMEDCTEVIYWASKGSNTAFSHLLSALVQRENVPFPLDLTPSSDLFCSQLPLQSKGKCQGKEFQQREHSTPWTP